MTPAHLRARAAIAALHVALDLLDQRADQEAQAIAVEYRAAAEPLASPAYGRRHALGGHGDPTADAIDTITAAPRANRYAAALTEVTEQLWAIAAHVPPSSSIVHLERLADAFTTMSEHGAGRLAVALGRMDARIRRLLHADDDRIRLARVRCPDCDTSGQLVLRTAAPESERVVECGACPGAWLAAEAIGAVLAA